MPATYDTIASFTLTTSTNSVDFTSIPQTYTDLRLVFTGYSNGTTDLYLGMRINGNSTTGNYRTVRYYGSTAQYANQTYIGVVPNTTTSAIGPYGNYFDFMNYRSTLYKVGFVDVMTAFNSGTGAAYGTFVALDTNPITSLQCTNVQNASGWTAGTVATLYGIKGA